MRDPMNTASVSFYNNHVDEEMMSEHSNGLSSLLNSSSRNHILEHPNMGVLRQQRLQRNKSAMKAVSPCIANHIMGKNAAEREEAAAVCIQRHFRGAMGRKLYRDLLFEQFEKEEEERLRKQRQQIEEGEILVENYHLRQEMEENDCIRRNKRRYEDSSAVTIQRVWRDYSTKLHDKLNALKNSHAGDDDDTTDCHDSFIFSPFEDDFYEEDLFHHHGHGSDEDELHDDGDDDDVDDDDVHSDNVHDGVVRRRNTRTTDERSRRDLRRRVSNTSEELNKELPPPSTDWNQIDNYLKSNHTQTSDSHSEYSPNPKVINRLSIGPDYLQLCFPDDEEDEDDSKEETEIKEYVVVEPEYSDKSDDDRKRDSGCDVKDDEINVEPADVKIINPKELENSDISLEDTEQVLLELESVNKPRREAPVDELRKKLERFSVRHLDTQIRDLRLKVKEISDELVQELLIRDQLHTKQDALLMDVEDAVKYAQSKHRLYQKCMK